MNKITTVKVNNTEKKYKNPSVGKIIGGTAVGAFTTYSLAKSNPLMRLITKKTDNVTLKIYKSLSQNDLLLIQQSALVLTRLPD